MNKHSQKQSVHAMVRGALIAALYVLFTFLSALFGLSSGVIQFRISEMLCVLPFFYPEAVPGLFLGCLLANLLTGCVVYDVIFGSLATLLGAVGTYLIGKWIKKKGALYLAPLPAVLFNALIVPPILTFAYGAEDGYLFLTATVLFGEAVSAYGGGILLAAALKKANAVNGK